MAEKKVLLYAIVMLAVVWLMAVLLVAGQFKAD